MTRRSAIILIALSVVVAAVAGCQRVFAPSTSTNTTNNSNTRTNPAPSRVVAEGRIEPAGGVIGLYATPGDRLIKYSPGVAEGAMVEAGVPLGELLSHRARQGEIGSLSAKLKESTAMRQAEQAASKADNVAAERTIEQIADAATQLGVKEAEISMLKNAYETARLECEKLARLSRKSDLVSGSALAQSKLTVQQSKTAIKVAESEYKALQIDAKAQLAVAKAKRDSIAASHDRALAMIPFESINEQVQALEEQANESRLPAPLSGTVLKINTKPGESIVNEPLLLIADLSNIVCVTEVYETYVNRLKVGQLATLRSPTFGDKNPLKGRIASIGRIIMTPDLKPLDPFAKADVRVVEVRIAVEPGNDADVASKLINLQVDVEIATDD